MVRSIRSKIGRRIHYTASLLLMRRRVRMRTTGALISFTFDDFPREALFTGGAILEKHGIAGTYFTSFGLVGTTAPTGKIFHLDDLEQLIRQGHEIGCHTFHHCNASSTPANHYEASIFTNRIALNQLQPGTSFDSHSYPIGNPSIGIKRCSSHFFGGCRGGGQTYNPRTVDLNHLRGYFIEQSQGDLDEIKRLVDANCRAGGWLIFATHDVCREHTRFGCSPDFFEAIVKYSTQSGAKILPMNQALKAIHAGELSLI